MSTALAIITARGGSKRIPHKNIKEFCAQPIIKYSIDAAIKSGCFDEVMVSTDDIKIAEIAKTHGANVPFIRSEKTSNDYATTEDVITEVLLEYSKLGKIFDYVCCIYPTAPFITAEKLQKACGLLKNPNIDSVIPVVKYNFPTQRAFRVENDLLKYISPENANARSQDLEPTYHDCGQFYFFKTESFLKNNTILTNNTVSLEMPESEVQDIDTEEDWKMAEIKYGFMHI